MAPFVLELWRRLSYFAQRRKRQAELREEMDTHLAMLAAESDPASARRRLGNATRWQEISNQAWGWTWLESLARDIVYGARLLVRSPGFTVTACLSLAIGLGATMGIFSLANALLFKTLPIPQPTQLYELGHNSTEDKDDSFSYPLFSALQKANNTAVPLFAVSGDNLPVNDGTSVRTVPALILTGDAFRILKLKPYLGRLLNHDDDIRGLPHGANCVLSYRLFQSQFHADPSALGKHLTIGAQSFTIVGVAPPDFFGFYVGSYSDLILPIAGYAATNPAQPILDSAGWTWLNILAGMPPNIPAQQLTAALNTVYPSLRKQLEPSPSEAAKKDSLYPLSIATGLSAIRATFAKPLYVLFTMTGLILLIACANLANLLLARSVVRNREMAIRLSIGAHRGRILRQLITESTLLALLGGAAGIPIYFACTQGLVAFLRSGFDSNVYLNTNPDWRFISGAAALLFSTVILFGFLPARRAMQPDLNFTMNETSQRFSGKTSFGNIVVAVQISLALVLLLGATLLSRSLFDLRTFDAGFRRDHLLTADVDTSQTIHTNAEVTRFFNRLLEKVHAIPGVRSAAASVVVPLSGRSWEHDYQIPGAATGTPHLRHALENWVTPEFFQTFGTSFLLGRNFDRRDSSPSLHVALVNQSFAAGAFGSANPIGRQVFENGKKDPITIIGIVGDARYRSLRADAPPTLYRPIAQLPPAFDFVLTLNLEVWTSVPARDLRKPIDKLLRQLDPQTNVDFHTFDSLIDSNLIYERMLTALSVAFGLIGLFLSAIGVYGLAAYSVTRRTAEFGIRIALGATPRSILSLTMFDQLRVLAVALTAGLLISLAFTQFLHGWLFGVSATDPVLYAIAIITIAAFSLLAALVPARRAASVSPLTALRCD